MRKEKILINDRWNMTEEFIGIDVLQTTDAPYHLASDEKDVRYMTEH